MVLEGVADSEELLVNLGENFLHLLDRHRSTNACNDVLALCVHKELAHAGSFSPVAGLRVNATPVPEVSPMFPNAIICTLTAVPQEYGISLVHTVDVRARVVPRTENCLDSLEELNLGIVREIGSDLILVLSLELICKLA